MSAELRVFELKSSLANPTDKITCLEYHENKIFIGLKNGEVVSYLYKNENITSTGKGSKITEMTRAATHLHHKCRVGKKPIQQMKVLARLNVLIVMCNGVISAHNLDDLGRNAHMLDIKGGHIFAVATRLETAALYVFVKSKKKIHTFSYEKQARRYVFNKELALPETPSVLECPWPAPRICLAMKKEYVIMDAEFGTLSEVVVPLGAPPCILGLENKEVLVSGGSDFCFVIDYKGDLAQSAQNIQFSQSPIQLVSCQHFVIALMANGDIEVLSLLDQTKVQKLSFPKAQYIIGGKDRVLVASETEVSTLILTSFQSQVNQLLEQVQVESALQLLMKTNPTQHELKKFHANAGFVLHNNLHFTKACDHFLLSDIDPREVISMFPEFTIKGIPYESTHPNNPQLPIDVIIADAQERNLHSDVSKLRIVAEVPASELKRRACVHLARYLWDTRQTGENSSELLLCIDTALLMLYVKLDQQILGEKEDNDKDTLPFTLNELLYPKNSCLMQQSSLFLLQRHEYDTLAMLCHSQGNTRKALDVWRRLGHGEYATRGRTATRLTGETRRRGVTRDMLNKRGVETTASGSSKSSKRIVCVLLPAEMTRVVTVESITIGVGADDSIDKVREAAVSYINKKAAAVAYMGKERARFNAADLTLELQDNLEGKLETMRLDFKPEWKDRLVAISKTIMVLKEVPDSPDLWEFAEWVLFRDAVKGLDIFTKRGRETAIDDKRILDYLKKIAAAQESKRKGIAEGGDDDDDGGEGDNVVIWYLEHLINEKHSHDSTHHNELAEFYLKRALALQTNFEKEKELEEARETLYNFLKTSQDYKPQHLLADLQSTNLYDELIVIYSILGQHRDVLRTYVFKKKDNNTAAKYCLRMAVEAASKDHQERARGSTADRVQLDEMKGGGRRCFIELLDLYFSDEYLQALPDATKETQQYRGLALLNKYALHIEPVEALQILPPDILVNGSLLSYLEKAIPHRIHQRRHGQIVKGLSSFNELKTTSEEIEAKQTYLEVKSDSRCPECLKPLGDAIISTFPIPHHALDGIEALIDLKDRSFVQSSHPHQRPTRDGEMGHPRLVVTHHNCANKFRRRFRKITAAQAALKSNMDD